MEYKITGGFVLIDDEDLPLISKYNWQVDNNGRATRRGRLLMHRLILPGFEVVHHKDGNPLNNQKSNLQGMDYRTHNKLHKSFTGGNCKPRFKKSKNPEKKCWEIAVNYDGKQKYFGLYEDPITAKIVYDLIWEELI